MIDDGSTDGSSEYAKSLNSPTRRVKVIEHHFRRGIGSAHVEGLRYALREKYKICISMDGDLTHDPKYIDELVSTLYKNDFTSVVIASRFLLEDGTSSWTLLRRLMTSLGHSLTQKLLRMEWDVSSGFRAYKVESIKPSMLTWLENSAYEFFPKSAYFLKKNNLHIEEIPVYLPKRTYGNSKMTLLKVIKLLSNIFKLRIDFRLARKRGLL